MLVRHISCCCASIYVYIYLFTITFTQNSRLLGSFAIHGKKWLIQNRGKEQWWVSNCNQGAIAKNQCQYTYLQNQKYNTYFFLNMICYFHKEVVLNTISFQNILASESWIQEYELYYMLLVLSYCSFQFASHHFILLHSHFPFFIIFVKAKIITNVVYY